jgi:hypothetical protein
MTRVGLAAAALALGCIMTAGSPVMPGAVEQAVAATKAERAAARAATRARRADCRRQARAQKLGMIKRQRFLRSCMRGA